MIVQQTKRPAAVCRVSSVAVAPAIGSAALAHVSKEGGQPHGRCPLAPPSVSKWLELPSSSMGVAVRIPGIPPRMALRKVKNSCRLSMGTPSSTSSTTLGLLQKLISTDEMKD